MDKCKHHPDYDPESGEPKDILALTDSYNNERQFPCPHCLQARCEWLEDRQVEFLDEKGNPCTLDEWRDEAIAHLEKLLADAEKRRAVWYNRYQDRFEKESRCREREAVLRKAMEATEKREKKLVGEKREMEGIIAGLTDVVMGKTKSLNAIKAELPSMAKKRGGDGQD